MIIFVNNKPVELDPSKGIAEVLRLLNIPEPKGIALAVNDNVIPKSDWNNFAINENDQLTIIRATQGG
jgi:sulfur carrier protein